MRSFSLGGERWSRLCVGVVGLTLVVFSGVLWAQQSAMSPMSPMSPKNPYTERFFSLFAGELVSVIKARPQETQFHIFSTMNITPAQRELALMHSIAVLENPGWAPAMARLVAQSWTPAMRDEDVLVLVAQSLMSFSVGGLNKLGDESQARLVQLSAAMLAAGSPQECKTISFRQSSPEAGVIERRLMLQLNETELRDLMGIYRESAALELSGAAVRTVTQQQVDQASAAHREVFRRLAERRFEARVRLRLSLDPASVTDDAAVCLWARSAVDAALEMEQPQRGWYMRSQVFSARVLKTP